MSRLDAGARPETTTVRWWFTSLVAVVAVAAARVLAERSYFAWGENQIDLYDRLSGQLPGSPNALAAVAALTLLVTIQTAVFGVARSHGASAPWSAFAGLSAVAAGQTLYVDAPTATPALLGYALVTLAWWMLVRCLDAGTVAMSWCLAVIALLVVVGQAPSLLALTLLLGALLVDARWNRTDPARVRRLLLVSAGAAVLATAVHAADLWAHRYERSVSNDQFLNLDLGDLAASTGVTTLTTVVGPWGTHAPVPLHYLGWFLPLFLLVLPALRQRGHDLTSIGIVGTGALVVILGPSQIGPWGQPVRMLPYVAACLAVGFAVMATAAWPRTISRRQQAAVLAASWLGVWAAWTAQPEQLRWLGVGAIAQTAALVAIMVGGARLPWSRRQGWAAALAIGASVLLLALQLGVSHTPWAL